MGQCHNTTWARQLGRRRGRWGAQAWARRRGAGMRGTRQAGRAAGCTGARPVHTWTCQLSQLGARAPGLVFRPGFRLGDVFESPFEPGS